MDSARVRLATLVVLLALLAPAGAVSGATRPHVSVPSKVTPGKLVRIRVDGFPAGSHVRVQFGVYFSPAANCCVTNLIPSIGKPGFALGDDGARTLFVRMPKRYAQCTSVRCEDPQLAAWKPGQRIYISASTVNEQTDSAYAKALSRVR